MLDTLIDLINQLQFVFNVTSDDNLYIKYDSQFNILLVEFIYNNKKVSIEITDDNLLNVETFVHELYFKINQRNYYESEE